VRVRMRKALRYLHQKCGSVLQCVAVRCSVSQFAAAGWRGADSLFVCMRARACVRVHRMCKAPRFSFVRTREFVWMSHALQNTATHCNTPQHTTTHFNTLQHTATHRNTPSQHTRCARHRAPASHRNTPQHTATHCNSSQRTAPHCNTAAMQGAASQLHDVSEFV